MKGKVCPKRPSNSVSGDVSQHDMEDFHRKVKVTRKITAERYEIATFIICARDDKSHGGPAIYSDIMLR